MSSPALSRRSSGDSLSSFASVETSHSEPDRFAPPPKDSRVWHSDTLSPDKYILRLSSDDVKSIQMAIIAFKLRGEPSTAITQDNFLLPEDLALKLRSCSKEIHEGSGVQVIRGLGSARFNDEESVLAFVGISCYVGPQRGTDSFANQTLSHIRDATQDKVPKGAEGIGLAGSKLPTAMEFHADRFSGDVLALYVKNTGGSTEGGDQYLASFSAIYNELLETDPEVLDTLAAEDWPFELKDITTKMPYLSPGAVMFYSKGRPMCQLVRAPLLGSPRIPRSETMPKLSSKQLHALQAVENIASRFCIELDRKEGDIQYIHNLSVLHARSAYVSKSEGASKRHLLRMFLRDPEYMWTKPARFAHKFENPFEEGREQNIAVLDLDPWRKISGRQSHG